MRFVIIFEFFIFLVLVACSFSEVNKIHRKLRRRKTFEELVFVSNATLPATVDNKKLLCKWLRGLRHQSRLCAQKGLGVILLKAKALAVNACVEEFEYDQWNCRNTQKTFKKFYRETALMASLATSAVAYSIAKGCAKELTNCECATNGDAAATSNPATANDTPRDWQWGGCGDNTKFARRLTRNFLQLRKRGGDEHADLTRTNSKFGLNLVMRSEGKFCKCHGVSNSCTMKICFKQLKRFPEIARALKIEYHNALRLPNVGTERKTRPGKLVYSEESPDFCRGTAGRRCKNAENCATLCCARDVLTTGRTVQKKCRCRMAPHYRVECDYCPVNETIYICK